MADKRRGKVTGPRQTAEAVRTLPPLVDEELDALSNDLPYLYLKFAEVHARNSGLLDTEFIEDYLPGILFDVAKTCMWVTAYRVPGTLSSRAVQDPETKAWIDPEVGTVGTWLVNKRFQSKFYSVIEPAMEALRRVAATHQSIESGSGNIRWKEPTPPQIIERFLKKKHWTKATLIRRMSGVDTGRGDDVDETDKQMLKRLYREPKREIRVGQDVRTVQRLTRLLAVMVSELPQDFGYLTVADLCWTPE